MSGERISHRVFIERLVSELPLPVHRVDERLSSRAATEHLPKRRDDEQWSLAELVLVDEAEALLNGVSRTYGHVVVDEAQDLSSMEVRAVARRCPSRSMTVLGDLAQATAPAAQSSWEAVVATLGAPAAATVEELALGYRVPASIMDVANRLLPEVAPGVRASAQDTLSCLRACWRKLLMMGGSAAGLRSGCRVTTFGLDKRLLPDCTSSGSN